MAQGTGENVKRKTKGFFGRSSRETEVGDDEVDEKEQ